MNIDLKKITNLSVISNAVSSFWRNYYRWFFILSLVIALGAGTYVWYNMVVNFQWTEEEKDNYRQSTVKEINLRADAFRKTLEEVKQRKAMFDGEYVKQKDIFKKY